MNDCISAIQFFGPLVYQCHMLSFHIIVGVRQSGYIRLSEGIQASEGLVQIQTNMTWVQKDWMFVKYDPGLSKKTVMAMCTESGHVSSLVQVFLKHLHLVPIQSGWTSTVVGH